MCNHISVQYVKTPAKIRTPGLAGTLATARTPETEGQPEQRGDSGRREDSNIDDRNITEVTSRRETHNGMDASNSRAPTSVLASPGMPTATEVRETVLTPTTHDFFGKFT